MQAQPARFEGEASQSSTRQRLRHDEATSNESAINRPQIVQNPVKSKKRSANLRQASTLSTDSATSNTKFIMIPKSFNEEVLITSHGPKQEVTYNTTCLYDHSRYYKSRVDYNHRYAPKMFETTLIVKPESKDYVYRERIDLVPKLRAHHFSETILTHPKKIETVYTTTLTHWDNYEERKYVTGIELVPAEKLSKSYKEFSPGEQRENEQNESSVAKPNGHLSGDTSNKTPDIKSKNTEEEYNERL